LSNALHKLLTEALLARQVTEVKVERLADVIRGIGTAEKVEHV
jgi:hypothetical protein